MTVVNDTVLNSGGGVASGKGVLVRLVGTRGAPVVGYVDADETRLVLPFRTTTDADGAWSADLVPNDDIIPSGTVYGVKVDAPGMSGIAADELVAEAEAWAAAAELGGTA